MTSRTPYLLFIVVSCLILSCSHSPSSTTGNKKLATDYFNEVINKGNQNLIDDIFSQDYLSHKSDGLDVNIIKNGALKKFISDIQKAFPDLHYEIDKIVAEGDMIALNVTATGTHKDEFLGYPATQKAVKYKEMFFFRIADNKFVEGWGLTDMKGLIEQISKP